MNKSKYRPPSHQTYVKCLRAFTWVILCMLGAGWAIHKQNVAYLCVSLAGVLFSALCADYYRQRWQFQLRLEEEMSDDE